MTDQRTPVTLLTGFLGAGKTTLLNAVLSDASEGRVAVIVNEFGETGLDHDLIAATDDEVVLMQSGCLCCTVRGELGMTIARLLTQRARGKLAFERIVIETTGLADPGPILSTLVLDRDLKRTTRMDGVVTVADAVHGATTLDEQFEAVSQAAMADLIVLSKTDVASPEQIVVLEERLRGLNGAAEIVHAVKGEGIAAKIWGATALRHGVSPRDALSWMAAPTPAAQRFGNLSGLAPATSDLGGAMPLHDSRIGSVSVELDAPVPVKAFATWVDRMTGLVGANLLRVKAILYLEGTEFPFVLHGVQGAFDLPVPLRDWPKDDKRSRIVMIGRDLDPGTMIRNCDILKGVKERWP